MASQSLEDRLEMQAAALTRNTEDDTGINSRVGAWIQKADQVMIDQIELTEEDTDDQTDLDFTNPNLAAQFAKGNLIFYVPPTAPRPGDQHDNDPLLLPPNAHDYHGIERLKQLLLPDDKGITCIRLLDARELMRYIAEGGRMQRRQDLEKTHPHIFASEELIHILLNELAKERTFRDTAGEEFIFFPGIVSLSYAWADPQHPDPQAELGRQLAEVLEWYLSERARLRQRVKREFKDTPGFSFPLAKLSEDEAPNTVMFGIFVDFMCLYQSPCSGVEEEYFKRAQYNVGMLYAHERTMVFQATQTPGGQGERTWQRRGWCQLEHRLAELASRSEYLLDISQFSQCRLARQFQFGTAAAYKKTGTKLASQGDGQVTISMLRATRIGLPVFVADFKTEMFNRAFTYPDDMDVCVKVYSTCSHPLLAEKEDLVLDGCSLSVEEWEQLPGMINICVGLKTFIMKSCGMTGKLAQQVLRNVEEGAFGRLTYLDLSHNQHLGDTGACALAEAMGNASHRDGRCCGLVFRRGRATLPPVLTKLRYLLLESCGIRERGGALVLEAVGKLRELGVLDLSNNAIGDGGMRGFDKLRAGELSKMLDMKLVSCGFGDLGCCCVVEAMSLGVMPKIVASGEPQSGKGVINMQGNAYPQAREALSAVLREREGSAGSHLFRSKTSSAAAIAKLKRAVGK